MSKLKLFFKQPQDSGEAIKSKKEEKWSEWSAFSDFMEYSDVNDESLLEVIKKYPHSFQGFDKTQTGKGTVEYPRNKNNVNRLFGLMLDYDYNPEIGKPNYTIEEFVEEFKNREFFLYTSVSNGKEKTLDNGELQPACDRFHVFFPAEKSIMLTAENKDFYSRAYGLAIIELKADKGAKDISRFFSPSPNPQKVIINVGENIKRVNLEDFLVSLNNKETERVEKLRKEKEALLGNSEYVSTQDGVDALDDDFVHHLGEKGQEYTKRLVRDTFSQLAEMNAIDEILYEKMLAWCNKEPEDVKVLVSNILGNNPHYKHVDSPESVYKRMSTWKRRGDGTINFATIQKDGINEYLPNFKMYDYIKIKTYATDGVWRRDFTEEEVVNYFNEHFFFLSSKVYRINPETKLSECLDNTAGFFDNLYIITNIPTKFGKDGITPIEFKRKEVKGLDIWRKSEKRKQYDSEGIYYDINKCPKNVLNLVVKNYDISENGVVVDSSDKRVLAIKKVIEESLCKNDAHKIEYMYTWISRVINYERTDVAIQIMGKEGAGKGMLARFIKAFLPQKASYDCSNSEELLGRFRYNTLAGKVFLNLEEAFFSGDKKAIEGIKQLITATQISGERKNSNNNPTVDNYVNILFSSNNPVITQISATDRRFFVMETSIKYTHFMEHKDREQLFQDFVDGCESIPVLNYFLNFFKTYREKHDIRWLSNPQNQKTAEKKAVIDRTMPPLHIFIKEIYNSNGIVFATKKDGHGRDSEEELNVYKERFTLSTLMDVYNKILPANARYYSDPRSFSADIKTLFENPKMPFPYKCWEDGKNRQTVRFSEKKVLQFLLENGIISKEKAVIEQQETQSDNVIPFPTKNEATESIVENEKMVVNATTLEDNKTTNSVQPQRNEPQTQLVKGVEEMGMWDKLRETKKTSTGLGHLKEYLNNQTETEVSGTKFGRQIGRLQELQGKLKNNLISLEILNIVLKNEHIINVDLTQSEFETAKQLILKEDFLAWML